MDLVYVGKIVGTHGIKGEIKIKSDFEKKESVFVIGNPIIIDTEEHIIKSYRVHKGLDMITIDEYNNINDVLIYVGKNVYVSRDSLNLLQNEYLLGDLIGLNVIYNNISYGTVSDYSSGINPLLCIKYDKDYYIPINSEYIKSVNLEKREIEVNNIEGLI